MFFEVKKEKRRCRSCSYKLNCQTQHKYPIYKQANNKEGTASNFKRFQSKNKGTTDVF